MKKLVLVLAAALLGMFMVTGSVYAQDKLAYVDLSRAFSEYNKTKDYDKKLTDKENSYVSERDKKVGEFNTLRDKFALLSDKDKEAKKGELESKAKALKDFVTQREEDLRKEQEEKMKEILQDIQDAVKSYSEKSGITFVFNDRVLVYQTKSMDITDNIIAILNKKR
ncbi:MAG: OmpH family outer membrane protein [Candidatus Omnitrophica bacterium]|jgi:Skp family chaperone for outer membrane proteins|nr:OmpH family outer membrane protein [Candidatus Omnitrophota bacterium]MDD3987503.1 OmpH family outer membrane protein [Candidatus Omnitrophota bacterium]MDD4981234.1 OmpH family outer membrane protein [Candidatus Omnitrophota bacterium]MDD5664743.1 OmpH family outer membrane protein [Candidatus Omnitrophota bacterium]